MKKKEYIKPEMKKYEINPLVILAGSVINMATDADYDEDAVDDYRDASYNIWAD